MGTFWALMLTVLVGAVTALGALLGVRAKRENKAFLTATMGFAGGVMLYAAFMEILPEAQEHLAAAFPAAGLAVATAIFFAGAGLVALTERLLPGGGHDHAHHHHSHDEDPHGPQDNKGLLRMALLSALAFGVHNLPEGLAVFMAARQSVQVGLPVAVAIALHNLPVGAAVAAPVFFASGSRAKGFWLALAVGLAAPLGALLGYFLLEPYLSDAALGVVFGLVAGSMVYIALDEMLPTAHRYGRHHVAMGGTMAGMAVMALSHLIF